MSRRLVHNLANSLHAIVRLAATRSAPRIHDTVKPWKTLTVHKMCITSSLSLARITLKPMVFQPD